MKKNGKFSLKEITNIMEGLLKGVSYLDENRIMHRTAILLGLCALAAWWGERNARCELFGQDSTKMLTKTREAHIST